MLFLHDNLMKVFSLPKFNQCILNCNEVDHILRLNMIMDENGILWRIINNLRYIRQRNVKILHFVEKYSRSGETGLFENPRKVSKAFIAM